MRENNWNDLQYKTLYISSNVNVGILNLMSDPVNYESG